MRKTLALLGGVAALSFAPLSASADQRVQRDKHERGGGHGHGGSKAPCGQTIRRGADAGYEVIFDGSRRCFARWRYAGGSRITLQRDRTLKAQPGTGGLGAGKRTCTPLLARVPGIGESSRNCSRREKSP